MSELEIAKIIRDQMIRTVGASVVMSWGTNSYRAIDSKTLKNLGIENSLGGLIFKVNGHHHKGEVIISLNGFDYYDVYICNIKGFEMELKSKQTNLAFYEFADWIDKEVEYIPEYNF